MPQIASLQMYDFEEIRWATDAFWRALARELGTDAELLRAPNHETPWTDPNLIFSQTCGFPLTHELRGHVRYVATPHYNVDGCEGPTYSSVVMARDALPLADFEGKVAAVNAPNSMSGMLALKLVFAHVAARPDFFGETLWTGSHLASLAAIQDGQADVCAIDCVTMALARKHRPALVEGLHEVARSQKVPSLPYISNSLAPEVIVNALTTVFADDDLREAREAMLLKGFSALDPNAYEIIRVSNTKVGAKIAL